MFSIAALFLIFSLVHAGPTKLPDKFQRCKRNDPKLNECLKGAIQNAIPQLVKGLPSYGIYTIDPLRVTRLDIDQGRGPVSVDLKFMDLDIKGFRTAKLKSVKANLDKYEIMAKVDLDQPLTLDGDYEIGGKVLILPITGKGKAKLKLDNLKASLTIKGKELKKNGQIYMDLQTFDVKFDTSRLHINLAGLFNNDKALGDNMNRFLNENWREILGEVRPAVEEALGATFREIAIRLFSKVPFDEIFLR